MTTTSELLLRWDRQRPRSQQREIGMSELGGCRKRAGFRLAGTEPTDAGGSVQAVLGTAIHDAIASVLSTTADPGDLVEHKVEFAGIVGRIDRYETAASRLIDVKSTSSRWLDHIKIHGPGKGHRYQTAGYAAALIKQGHPVSKIRIDYIARDTGEEWQHERDFSVTEVGEALAWLAEVRDAPLDMLPRDYAPDSPFCQHCPFLTVCWDGGVIGRDVRSVLYVNDPDAARWAEQLWQARQDKKAAEEREQEARGALDAIRPNDQGTEIVDVGWRLPLRWTVTRSNRLDTAAVKAEYAKAGAAPPMKEAAPTIKVDFAPKDAA